MADKTNFTIHPQAIVEENVLIGTGTRIWAFVHILPGVSMGQDCNICDHVFIEGGVKIGDRVTVKCGIYLWEGLTVEDDVFLGPNVVFTNDKHPRSKKYLNGFLKTQICRGASIGANATVLPGLTIGRYAMVGAGTVVTSDVPEYGLLIGNPGRLAGWVCRCGERLKFEGAIATCSCGASYELGEKLAIKECATDDN